VAAFKKAQTRNESKQDTVHVAEIVRHGDRLIVPESMPLARAIKVLDQQMQDEEQLVAIMEPVDAFPWEGALAFRKAIEEMFGYGGTIATPGFFGPRPPSEIAVETGIDSKVMVPWGRIRFALGDSDDEFLHTGVSEKDGRMIFAVQGVVKKKWKATIGKLADLTREYVKRESIYRGQALRIVFTNSDGDPLPVPEPKFIDLSSTNLGEMVYTDELTALIETNVMTPLKYAPELRAASIPLKRGVLLAGPYGTASRC
jgi:transitional endoplasmic reticulum ATPase